MARRQSLAVFVKSQANQEARVLCIGSCGPIDPVLGKHSLDFVPQGFVDNRRMLTGIGVTLVRDLTPIDAVLEHQIKRTAGQFLAAIRGAIRQRPPLAPDSHGIKFGM
jgi:hypothetical protein